MKKIAVLGNNSGRNAGDAAILGNLLDDISAEIPGLGYHVPTTNAAFIRKHFGHHAVKPVPMMPWNGCLKNFGLPLFRTMTKSDLVLICDNILFDRKFYNPVFNNLSSIALYAPFCKKRNIPIVFYNVSVGPIDFPVGKRALQKVLDATAMVITRDSLTQKLFDKLGVNYPELHVHADCALNTNPPSDQRLDEIVQTEGLFSNPKGTIGFNVNAYLDNWSPGGSYSTGNFSPVIAEAADRVIDELDVDIIFFTTQIMDIKNARECIDKMKHLDRVKLIGNDKYTYQEIAGLLGKVGVHIGLRTHTLIFCAAMGTPMIDISSYPKSQGFMQTLGREEWAIHFDQLTPENIANTVRRAWSVKDQDRIKLLETVQGEKQKARASAGMLKQFL